MGASLSSSRNHLWSVKENENWKNNKKRNKLSNLQNIFDFWFFPFGLLLLSSLITFLFRIHFKQFKVLSFINYFLTLIKKKSYKEFSVCLGINLCNIWWFVFWVFDPSISRGHNFFNSIPFLTIFTALNTPIGRVQVLFRC
jgi:hypothetical protein